MCAVRAALKCPMDRESASAGIHVVVVHIVVVVVVVVVEELTRVRRLMNMCNICACGYRSGVCWFSH